MTLEQLLRILHARYALALAMLFATVATTVAVSLALPKQYVAAAAVVVDVKSPDPIVGVYLPAISMPGYMATQVDILNSERVAQRAVKLARLDENEQVKAQWLKATGGKGSVETWLAARLQKAIDIKPSRESNVINIGYKAGDPATAAAVANAYAQAYIDTTVELKVEPAKRYAQWFETQSKSLRANLETARNRLTEYQQRKRIIASDERLDNETAKLNELSTQLTAVEGQIAEAQGKQRASSASGALPEVAQNALITNLKVDISRLEGKLKDVAGNLGNNHPQYQRMESELAELKKRLAAETAYIAGGFAASRTVGVEKEARLRAAIEKQRKKLLDMKRERGDLDVLQRDVEAAQKALDAVTHRFNQASLESQSTQTNVSMLTSAFEPTAPSSPKILLNTLASMVLGTLLGLGAVLLLELRDRRVRSLHDLTELPGLALLGVIPKESVPANATRRLAGSRPAALESR